jgi:hypothetical protein
MVYLSERTDFHNRWSLTSGYENQSFQDKDDVEQKCDSLVCAMSGVSPLIANAVSNYFVTPTYRNLNFQP